MGHLLSAKKNKTHLGHNHLVREPSENHIIWILNQIMQRKVTGKLVARVIYPQKGVRQIEVEGDV